MIGLKIYLSVWLISVSFIFGIIISMYKKYLPNHEKVALYSGCGILIILIVLIWLIIK